MGQIASVLYPQPYTLNANTLSIQSRSDESPIHTAKVCTEAFAISYEV